MMKLLMLLLLIPSYAAAWTLSADFESGTIGQKAQGASGFSSAGTATLYDSTVAHGGSKGAKMVWTTGNVGFGIDHGEFTFPSRVYSGGEVWIRGYYYFPTGWSWTANPGVKILRTHIANSTGGNVGYLSVLAGGLTSAGNYGHYEASNEPTPYQPILPDLFDINAWQCIEMYTKLSTTSPVMRIWKNGVLIFEDTTRPTIAASTDYADFAYVMTYWNGGAPQDQTQYLDDFAVTTDTPAGRDAAGNPMIGPTDTPAQTTHRSLIGRLSGRIR